MLRDKNTTDHSLRNFIVSFNDKDCPPIHVSFNPLAIFLHDHADKDYNWAILDHNQCKCCPLNKKDNKYCPAALSMASLLNPFSNCMSIEPVTVEAEDHVGRQTFWKTDLQTALFALTRTSMFFSGCPITEKFRGFITDLRPLATDKEILKALVIRFLLMFKGDKEATKNEIKQRIKELHCINQELAQRLHSKMKGDAVVNSLIISDCIGMILEMDFEEIYQEICDDIKAVECSGILRHRSKLED